MEYMFTMMNNARLAVGVQGLAIADRAYQQARAFARDRVQSRDIAGGNGPVPIIAHPDVRRMLMTMKAQNEAMRALAYFTAGALDRSKREPDEAKRRASQAVVDLLTPVSKAWCTDLGVEIASLGVQVHGGMGFVEETGAAQYYRDARIAPIYEGTNGIQALDLLSRKLVRDKGAAARGFVEEMRQALNPLGSLPGNDGKAIRQALERGLDTLSSVTGWLVEAAGRDIREAAAGASPYLRLFGTVTGGWLMGRAAVAAGQQLNGGGGDGDFLKAKIATARFYADNVMPQATGLAAMVTEGAASTLALDPERF